MLWLQNVSACTLLSKAVPPAEAVALGRELIAHAPDSCLVQVGEFELRKSVLPACHVLRAATVNCARLFGI